MNISILKAPKTTNTTNYIKLFLGGGIQKCPDWQSEITSLLNASGMNLSKDLLIINPRQEEFNISDLEAGIKQINWEFNYLNQMDIFSMFFYGPTDSDQPICFYELGRYIEVMKQRFQDDWQKRIVISTSSKFKRSLDVMIQTNLATNNTIKVNINDNYQILLTLHSNQIIENLKSL